MNENTDHIGADHIGALVFHAVWCLHAKPWITGLDCVTLKKCLSEPSLKQTQCTKMNI